MYFGLHVYQKKAGDKAKASLGKGLVARPSYATLLQELNRNEYKNYQRWFFRISRQMSVCICLRLPVLILSMDSDWLISTKLVKVWLEIGIISICVKVGQTLTNSVKVVFTLSKFPIKVCQSELGKTLTNSVKVVFTLSKFPIKVCQSELGQTLTNSVKVVFTLSKFPIKVCQSELGQTLTNSVKVVFTLSKFPIKVCQSELGQTLTNSVKVVFTLSKFPIKVCQSELGQTLTKLTLIV